MMKAVALLAADQVVRGHAKILEHELAGIDPLVAELLEPPGDAKARPLLDHEQRHAAVARLGLRVGLDQQGQARALDAVGDPALGAVDDVVVAIAHGTRTDRLQVGAAVGLGEREAAAQLARGKARQEAALLGFGAEALHGGRHHQVRAEDAGERHPDLGHARDHAGVGQRRHAEAAVFGRDRSTEQAELLHLLDHARADRRRRARAPAPAGAPRARASARSHPASGARRPR